MLLRHGTAHLSPRPAAASAVPAQADRGTSAARVSPRTIKTMDFWLSPELG